MSVRLSVCHTRGSRLNDSRQFVVAILLPSRPRCDSIDVSVTESYELVRQSGLVQVYSIINGQVNVDTPLMTIYGDKEFSRFGANVLVSSLCVRRCNSDT